MVSERN